MFCLQNLLRARALSWLKIGGNVMRPGEIPWFWMFRECRLNIAEWHWSGQRFIIGPNVLFLDSRKPCQHPWERTILESPGCVLLFTESCWYERLIREHQKPACKAEIVVWPYPVSPEPEGPILMEHDLLIYVKSGADGQVICELQRQFPFHATFIYGTYNRDEMIHAARRASCCVYLSDDDRMPIAASEIALAGCPLIGIERGCPHTKLGLGVEIEALTLDAIQAAILKAQAMKREEVRATAQRVFDPQAIVDTVIAALDKARRN